MRPCFWRVFHAAIAVDARILIAAGNDIDAQLVRRHPNGAPLVAVGLVHRMRGDGFRTKFRVGESFSSSKADDVVQARRRLLHIRLNRASFTLRLAAWQGARRICEDTRACRSRCLSLETAERRAKGAKRP